ncbi:MAG TPA: hypothetical protein VNW06_12100 [Cytophagaceae bacterium]|nr:hypothetical protein [Cytophagaceae bacterium]
MRGVALYTYVIIKRPGIERMETPHDSGAFHATTEGGKLNAPEKNQLRIWLKRMAE